MNHNILSSMFIKPTRTLLPVKVSLSNSAHELDKMKIKQKPKPKRYNVIVFDVVTSQILTIVLKKTLIYVSVSSANQNSAECIMLHQRYVGALSSRDCISVAVMSQLWQNDCVCTVVTSQLRQLD